MERNRQEESITTASIYIHSRSKRHQASLRYRRRKQIEESSNLVVLLQCYHEVEKRSVWGSVNKTASASNIRKQYNRSPDTNLLDTRTLQYKWQWKSRFSGQTSSQAGANNASTALYWFLSIYKWKDFIPVINERKGVGISWGRLRKKFRIWPWENTKFFHGHLMESVGVPAPPCPYCGECVVTVKHVLIECRSLST